MFVILGIMFAGIGVGVLLRRYQWVKKGVSVMIMPVIYVLLFVMGLSVGANPDIIDNLSSLGLEAALITFGALTGSLMAAKFVWKRFFKKENNDA